jgi:RNA polymerase sigma-70 factor (ECF subfamily)
MLDRTIAEETGARLLGRIAAQDAAALGEFYDLHAGLLFSVAMRILEDTSEAEEVIQDAFLQIWQKAASFDNGLGSALSWAVGITRNRAIDRLRSRQRRHRMAEALQAEAGATVEFQDPPAQGFLGEDEAALVRGAVDHLPAEQRQAIEMAFFRGLTHEQIAETLQQPLGTIKARIRRGMMKLRDCLQSHL